jgi:DNA replication and repair protein RecF
MKIETLRMVNFRRFVDQQLDWQEGIHLLWGANGEGKTSVIEAIHVLATSRSFRSAKDQEMVRFGSERAALSGAGVGADAREELRVVLGSGPRQLERSGKRVGLMGYAGALEAVVFGGGSLDIARGGPQARRRFLDRAIAAGRPSYLRTLGRYGRALSAWREVALHAGAAAAAELESYEELLGLYGAEIQQRRAEYVDQIGGQLEGRYRELFGAAEGVSVRYRPSPTGRAPHRPERLQAGFAASRRAALAAPGPQRDDMELLIDRQSLRTAGSAGQQRGVVLALILWVAERTGAQRGSAPILLIDDLEAELDPERARRLVSTLARMGQVFVTSTRRDIAAWQPGAAVYELRGGEIERAA